MVAEGDARGGSEALGNWRTELRWVASVLVLAGAAAASAFGPAHADEHGGTASRTPTPPAPAILSAEPTAFPTATPSVAQSEPTPTDEPTPTVDPTPTANAEPEPGTASPEARVRARQPGEAVAALDDVFRPMELTVTVGTEVVWTNEGDNPHTVTADDRAFDSGTLEPGQRFSVTFDQVGRVPYYCQIHGAPGSGMFGVVVVQAAPTEEAGGGDEVTPETEPDALARTGADAISLGLGALGLLVAGLALLRAGRRATPERG